ncbi:MAG: MaoC family dehydratase N-terminal domain-containing protein [Hyphomicrobiaceae bacterium]
MTAADDELRASIGRSQTSHDVVTASQIGRLASALGVAHPAPSTGDAIPPGWQDVFFPPLTPLAELREDGQPAGGSIMPKVALPSRRLARVSTRYFAPLRIGDTVSKVSEIADARTTGEGAQATVLVTVRATISNAGGRAVVEERDYEFFTPGSQTAARSVPPAPASPAWQHTLTPTPVMLFRMSASSFNSHRVHYDRDYTVKKEGHPGLVVPVTLASCHMLEPCRRERPERPVASFWFSSAKRLYDDGDIRILGQPDAGMARFWALNSRGETAVVAEAQFGG